MPDLNSLCEAHCVLLVLAPFNFPSIVPFSFFLSATPWFLSVHILPFLWGSAPIPNFSKVCIDSLGFLPELSLLWTLGYHPINC